MQDDEEDEWLNQYKKAGTKADRSAGGNAAGPRTAAGLCSLRVGLKLSRCFPRSRNQVLPLSQVGVCDHPLQRFSVSDSDRRAKLCEMPPSN